MTIFSCNNLAKSYNDKLLFENISFGLDVGDRVGIIGKNGAGKTTLMKIIASKEFADEGTVIFNNNVRYEFLDQLPEFETTDTVLHSVLNSKPEINNLLEEYHRLCAIPKERLDAKSAELLEKIVHQIEELDCWNYENEAKKILSMLGINRLFDDVKNLSGGLKKRVALARALLSEPDLLILDEPTNHLDADSVQWLQDRLQSSKTSLLFVTHDRYFLDAVATKIIEIDEHKIFSYPGNYEEYLEKKESYVKTKQSTLTHTLSRLRSELAWLQKGAKARRTKQRSRVDWIDVLKKQTITTKDKKIKIELGKSFMGSRIIEAHNIYKKIANQILFNDFTYLAKPKDRIGIIGPNGTGKSTLLSVLAGYQQPDKGRVEIGGSAKIGYFRQEIIDLKPGMSVAGSLKEIAEFIDVGEGRDRYLTTRDMLDMFNFPRYQHSSLISTLSGGERRRLALVRVLMANPNVLLLDEPTNDFDLQTLTALEEYLDDFYGVLIIVSHDRAFLDRTVNFILSFDGEGNIKEYPGNYSNYLEKKEAELRNQNRDRVKVEVKQEKNKIKKKLAYMEQREYDELNLKIPQLEKAKSDLEDILSKGDISDYNKLAELSQKLNQLNEEIDISTMRWLELEDSIEE